MFDCVRSAAQVVDWLVARCAAILGLGAHELDLDATFADHGFTSRELLTLVGSLEDWTGTKLTPVLLYDYPTIRTLAARLASTERAQDAAIAAEGGDAASIASAETAAARVQGTPVAGAQDVGVAADGCWGAGVAGVQGAGAAADGVQDASAAGAQGVRIAVEGCSRAGVAGAQVAGDVADGVQDARLAGAQGVEFAADGGRLAGVSGVQVAGPAADGVQGARTGGAQGAWRAAGGGGLAGVTGVQDVGDAAAGVHGAGNVGVAGAGDVAEGCGGAVLCVEGAPLSEGQRALWMLQERAPRAVAYNLAWLGGVYGLDDFSALADAWRTLIAEHPVLRCVIDAPGVQRVTGGEGMGLECVASDAWDEPRLRMEIDDRCDRPFDLARGPLARATVFLRAGRPFRLLIVVHHVVADLRTLELISHELGARCVGGPTALAAFSYAEHVAAEQRFLQSPRRAELIAAWRDELRDVPMIHELPMQGPRPSVSTFRGASCERVLADGLVSQLRAAAGGCGTTPFVVCLAAFAAVLWRHSGQAEVVIGTPAAGRSSAAQQTLGFFSNALPIRVMCGAELSFRELVLQLRATVARAIDRQELPFPVLVRELAVPRDASRTPLFQTFFVWGEPSAAGDAWSHFEPLDIMQRGAPFDLTLTVMMVGAQLRARLQFNVDLFSPEYATRLLDHFANVLEAAVRAPRTQLALLPLMADEEVQAITVARNQTLTEYEAEQPVHRLFERQVLAAPSATAIVFEDERVSYAELEQRASAIAQQLSDAGLPPGAAVALCLSRGPTLVAAILGVWKLGACYVPLDISHPPARVREILADSGAQAVLVDVATEGQCAWPVPWFQPARAATGWRAFASVDRAELAYIMYTSGTTGTPKGVEVLHRGVVNCVEHFRKALALSRADVWLALTTVSFDISVLELFAPLLAGATVHLADDRARYEPARLISLMRDSNATVMQATPAQWSQLVAAGMPRFDELRLLCGGEALAPDLAERLLERAGEVWNVYGPTETTIWSSAAQLQRGATSVSAGKPIANTRLYVLDEQMQPVPDGVAGELHIAGDGLARGYRNAAALTEAKFKRIAFEHVSEQVHAPGALARRYRRDAVPTEVKLESIALARGSEHLNGCTAIPRHTTGGSARRYRNAAVPEGAKLESIALAQYSEHLNATDGSARGHRDAAAPTEAELASIALVHGSEHLNTIGGSALGHRDAASLAEAEREGERFSATRGDQKGAPPTAAKFETNEHARSSERVYATGDRARWNAQGEIEILGRFDQQIKLNGHRIEPSEIESALRKHPFVADAVAMVNERKRLVAFIVWRDPGEVEDVRGLRSFLLSMLPAYSVPSAFVSIAEIPRSLAGKVDRRALSAIPALAQQALVSEPPRTDTERYLLEVWRAVLEVEGMGVTDDFFELGGASLQSIDIATRAKRSGLDVTPDQIFERRNVRELARHLAGV